MSDRDSRSTVVPLDGKPLPAIPDVGRLSVAHQKVTGQGWRGKLFRDFNARGSDFEDCDFRNAIFERAYFRDSKFTNCRFDGARFSECNIKTAKFYGCDMRYVLFQRCQVDLEELIAALPPEPNLRREALQNLQANAVEIGDYGSRTRLILQELKSAKLHYSYAVCGYSSYYKRKYSGFLPKIKAGLSLLGLYISDLIWGHGEKPTRLLWSCLAILCSLTLINFWSVMPRVGWVDSQAGLKPLEYVVRLFLDMSTNDKFQGNMAIDYIAVLMRYLYIGLFISVLYKSISHR
jgi:hypothetical protein